MNGAEAARLLLMGVVVPLWIGAGLADWAAHRRTRIQDTSGLAENLFHWLLLVEGGIVLLAAALLQPAPAMLLIVLGGFLAHELTTWIELRYTVPRREVRPTEQMVHSFMEILPLAVLLLLAVEGGAASADWALRWREQPWPPGYLAGMALAVVLLNVLPLAEECRRCLRSRTRRRPAPT